MCDESRFPTESSQFESLIRRARAGEREAIGELISEWRDYLLVIAGEDMDRELQAKLGASDLVQQTMATAGQKFEQFRGDSPNEFRAWIRQILKNDLHDARRKFKGTGRRDVQRERSIDVEHEDTQLYDADQSPSAHAINEEYAAILRQAMGELPGNYQQIIEFRNWDELGFEEIARRMDCTPDAARKLWYRAIVKLEEIINQSFPEIKSGSLFRPP